MAQMFGGGLPRRLLGLTLGASVALGAAPGIAARAALAQEDAGSTYEVEIPATVAVAKAGWNATAGISAKGSLAPGKKLAVTAASTNGWALKSGQNGVEYKLAESGDASTTYAGAAEKTSWEFATLSADAQTQPMGVVVDDYASAAPGDYADTVTFTVAVEDAAKTITIGEHTLVYADGDTWGQVVGKNRATYLDLEIRDGDIWCSEGLLCYEDWSPVHETQKFDPTKNYLWSY